MKNISFTLVGVLAFIGVVFASPLLVRAAEFGGGEMYTLPRTETVLNNFYAIGGNVVIAGNVQGDLGVAGGTVLLTGMVGQDVLALGGTLNIAGTVAGDVRVLGGSVTVSGNVQGEVFALGGTVHVAAGVTVGNITALGGRVIFDGVSGSNSRFWGGQVVLNGTVLGDVEAKVKTLTLGDQAKIQGALRYQAPQAAAISSQAQVAGTITYEPKPDRTGVAAMNREEAKSFVFLIFGAWWLTKLVMALVMALVFFFVFPAAMTTFVRETLRGWKKDLLWGLLALFVTPLSVALLFLTVLGAPLAVLVLLVYLTHLMLASLGAGVFLGSVALKYIAKRDVHPVTWQSLTLGIVLLALFGLVPFIGWFVVSVFFLIALGGLVRHTFKVLALGR